MNFQVSDSVRSRVDLPGAAPVGPDAYGPGCPGATLAQPSRNGPRYHRGSVVMKVGHPVSL